MNKEEIILKFVNSDEFSVIEDYISKPYIETIKELEQERNKYKELYEKEKEKNEKAIEYLTNGYLINTRELKSILNGELSDIEKSLNKLKGDK